MSRMYRNMLAMAGAMLMANDPFMSNGIDPTPRDSKPTNKEELQRYMQCRTFHDNRQLREFSIKGHKVKAYSKKDAITRLKHQKKI